MTIGIHGSQARLYINDLDMSLYVEQVDQEITRQTAEHTPLAAQTTNRAVGVNSVTLNLAGSAYVADSNAAHHWEQAQASDNALYAFVPGGDVVGRVVYCAHSMQGDMSITAPSSDIVRIPFGHLGTGQLDRAVILRAMSTGGTAPGATHDATADSVDGGAAYLFCTALGGTEPELAVTLQHSDDGLDWSTLVAMTALEATGAEKKAVAGEVKRYLRVTWTLTGTEPTARWFAAFARH